MTFSIHSGVIYICHFQYIRKYFAKWKSCPNLWPGESYEYIDHISIFCNFIDSEPLFAVVMITSVQLLWFHCAFRELTIHVVYHCLVHMSLTWNFLIWVRNGSSVIENIRGEDITLVLDYVSTYWQLCYVWIKIWFYQGDRAGCVGWGWYGFDWL